MLKFYI